MTSSSHDNGGARRALIMGGSIVAAIGLYFILPSDMNELARRTVVIFFLATVFWVTEVMPLFATSLCLVAMEILALASSGGLASVLPAMSEFPVDDAGEPLALSYKTFLNPFSSGIIVLFMGGFLLSAAVTKQGIDRIIAARCIRPFMRSPLMLIFGVLCITAFFSMWMSNTATAAMMLAISAPLVRALPADDKYHRAVILAVPFGANIGGIGTPIGTPPNAVALQFLQNVGIEIGFIDWMLIAVPLMLLLLVVAGFLLFTFFPPEKGLILPEMEKPEPMTREGKITLIIMGLTIVLWLTSKWHPVHPAVVALLAAAALTAMRILDRHDVDSIDWNILLLMWGGLALGTAMQSTQLVDYIVTLPIAELQGFGLALAVIVVAVMLSNFMSNTAAANLLVPIATGLALGSQAAQAEMAILVAMGCSIAMAMPIATPPNAMAFATGRIPATSLIRSGGSITLIAMVVILLGYQFMIPLLLRLSGV